MNHISIDATWDSFLKKNEKKKKRKIANTDEFHQTRRIFQLFTRERGTSLNGRESCARERKRWCRDATPHSGDLITLRSGINFHANSAWTLPWNLVAGLKTRPPGSIQLLAYDSRGNNLCGVPRVCPATWDIGRYRFARKVSGVWLLCGRRTRDSAHINTRVVFVSLLAREACTPSHVL